MQYVQVSVISNETTDEKKKKEATNETANPKEEKSKELKETTIKIGSEDESNPLNVTKNETNSNPKIDFHYEKFMKELKASHDKLSKLNEALKMNKKIVPSISSGITKVYQIILFQIFKINRYLLRKKVFIYENR